VTRRATNKQVSKRRVARAYLNLERTLDQLAVLYHVFKEPHPELAEALMLLAQQVIVAQDMLVQFWETCWGEPPENWESWAE
jgi:hypothetical protein